MNYIGKVLMPKKISGEQVTEVIRTSLSQMYQQGRFLDGFTYTVGEFEYHDISKGGVSSFYGRQWITLNEEIVYELLYHGGLIK